MNKLSTKVVNKSLFQIFFIVASVIFFQMSAIHASPIAILESELSHRDTIKDSIKIAEAEWTQKIVTQDGDKKVVLETRNGEITSLEINGKIIPKEEYGQFDDIIKKNTKVNGLKLKPFKGSDFSFENFGSQNFNNHGDTSRVFKFRIQDIDSIFGESGFKMGDGGTVELRLKQLFDNQIRDSIILKMFDRNKGLSDGTLPEGFEELFNFSRPLKIETDEFGHIPKQLPDNNKGGSWKNNTINKNLEQLLGEQLNKDGLLATEKENKIELSGKYLRINGQKMPQITFEKFKSLFEIETGMPLNDETILSFKMDGKLSKRQFKAF